jgi:hypothetical protein
MSGLRDIAELERTPANHFRLHVYDAIAALRAQLPEPDDDNGLRFLSGYYAQLDGTKPGAVERWEESADVHLPVRALRAAYGLTPVALTLLFTVGLAEEDARFGALFEALNGIPGETRPTLGLLSTWSEDDEARDALASLLESGLIEAANADAARQRRALQVPSVLWDALRGRTPAGYTPPERARRLEGLRLPDDVAAALARVPQLLDDQPLVVRGPRTSGRHTVIAAVARALGRGVLRLDSPLAGAVATALHALPVFELEPGPGETAELPQLGTYTGPLAVVLGRAGGLRAENAVVVHLGIPDVALRRELWRDALEDDELAAGLATALRLPAGGIHRLARLAQTEAALAGRPTPGRDDVRVALGALDAQELETLATRVHARGGWEDVAVVAETERELRLLEHRCRVREELHGSLTPGVRALFSGPTGTGKTLAARALASVLGKELFAVDLSMVVNKYLGETEKNLDAVFSRAEELDVVLLLDEGDALMTRRTDVQTSNDRYANLETNFLLQRLESYEGILVVTTNAGDRIDSAFRRRLDVVVEFRVPDVAERWSIWQLHLPPAHAVDDAFLDELSVRCQLTGGQIRNAVLHASLLALEDGSVVESRHVDQAVRREYRKTGAVCPLRTPAVVHG